jgi:hypothetical protein
VTAHNRKDSIIGLRHYEKEIEEDHPKKHYIKYNKTKRVSERQGIYQNDERRTNLEKREF